ncbi:MAG: BamA/TamA family outer membrane protein [Bacteroidetes bacterium]|nr:BamA/TamA family outer membrane protein [Bacteroidota bacterium]MBS1739752.1 BamA/TamA family outer membrane protein [Bacteroidota bacterium]MBS1776709.1 BamA/TamA family outer membrane protein [Bacteroidota bacterium]
MSFSKNTNSSIGFLLLLLSVLSFVACNSTKHLPLNTYLLKKNEVKLTTDKGITHRGELRDNINRLVAQKPNTYLILGSFPYKVWLYNLRYQKHVRDSLNVQKNKMLERPVIYDSAMVIRSTNNIRSYLFNQGYFYPQVEDTTIFSGQKATVVYRIKTGINFQIRKTILNVDDSTIRSLVKSSMNETILKEGLPFSMNLLEQERSRITNFLREQGYYKFTQENVVDFQLDTFNKDLVRDVYNPFEVAINFITAQKTHRNPTLDIRITIRAENHSDVYRRYAISDITVFPDFTGREDVNNSTMIVRNLNGVSFRYHKRYVKERVILKHIFLEEGKFYSQTDYDATINKLNQLGVFQTIRIFLLNDSTKEQTDNTGWLKAYIVMTPSKRYDITTSFDVSTGTTYVLGAMPAISLRNFNLGKGANLLTTSVSGGVESNYNNEVGNGFFQHFSLLTKTFSANANVSLPKFLGPFGNRFTKGNTPRTIIGIGTSLLDRLNYFTLTNTTANFTYNWRETDKKTWEFSPSFINIVRLPKTSDSFQTLLDSNSYLKNSYRPTFIEGENVAFTFSNQIANKGRSYSYVRLALEEAGGLMGAVSNFGISNFNFSQYFRFDFDTRRYINRRRSQLAFRFYGGIGIPYGNSPTLPYIKQYFVGGGYSIRGWRIRTLGPGSYYNPNDQNSNQIIDRTGDIKLEANGEYRFDMLQLFSGGIKVRGALFADAGNIWLTQPSASYPGGDFNFSQLGNDIAISAGAGARFDLAGFFIIRLDAAFPMKIPYNSIYNYGGWTGPFIKHNWGMSDILLNIALGYPF